MPPFFIVLRGVFASSAPDQPGPLSPMIITPTAFAGWQHEFLQNSYGINSTFATGGPAAPFNYNTSSPARDNFYGGVGVTVGVGESWQATFIYSASAANQDNSSQNLYLGLGYKF